MTRNSGNGQQARLFFEGDGNNSNRQEVGAAAMDGSKGRRQWATAMSGSDVRQRWTAATKKCQLWVGDVNGQRQQGLGRDDGKGGLSRLFFEGDGNNSDGLEVGAALIIKMVSLNQSKKISYQQKLTVKNNGDVRWQCVMAIGDGKRFGR